jgi:sporulation protein YlmC with PRC-barrel domain
MTIRASALLGASVVDRRDCRLGKLSDLLLDEAGLAGICYAMIDIDARQSGGSRTVAVPWSILRPIDADRRLLLDVNKSALRQLKDVSTP